MPGFNDYIDFIAGNRNLEYFACFTASYNFRYRGQRCNYSGQYRHRQYQRGLYTSYRLFEEYRCSR